MRITFSSSVASFALAAACGAESPRPEPAPPAPPPQAPSAASPTRWGLVRLPDVPATIALFDPDGWRVAPSRSFVVLEHAPTRSILALRVWNASRLVRPAECEAEARLLRPTLPEIDPDAMLEARALERPEGFHGRLVVGFAGARDSLARGYVLAVGAAVGRCFVGCFETLLEEGAAPRKAPLEAVAERLRDAADGVFASLILNEVDDRLPPSTRP